MFKKSILILALFFVSFSLFSQSTPFNVRLEPVEIPNLGGIHSFAIGQHNGKWLIVGGRLDGLHQRMPFAAFNVAGNNINILVIDPVSKQKWSASLSSLPLGIQEQLSATNAQFHQEGDYLYIVGGYGYSATTGDHTTYDKLTAIKVSDVIQTVIDGNDFTSYFRQITDAKFQVTGGRLKKMYDKYYLVGGQKFIGRYNPMGPDHGQGFIQEYTDAARIFTLDDDGTTITISHFPEYFDTDDLHRRDYNVESQIMPNGSQGITSFAGVFQKLVDLPFLNTVDIDSSGFKVNNDFQQYYNHYHCPVIPLYSDANNEMHTVFFGGIAQYYDSLGVLVQDNNVPFVNTIARVTRNSQGEMAEYKMSTVMPTLLGAGSEFIPKEGIPQFENEVLKLDQIDLTENGTHVGYIYGGISSSQSNIFFINDGTQSQASDAIFKVYLVDKILGTDDLNEQSQGSLQLTVLPNPSDGNFEINYNLTQRTDVVLTLTDINGQLIERIVFNNQSTGKKEFQKRINPLYTNGVYFLNIETSYEKAFRKIILKK